MAKAGQNEGIRVLDEFVCDAIPANDAIRSAPRRHGRNEGMRIVEELQIESTLEDSKQDLSNRTTAPQGSRLDPAMQSLADQLAAFIAVQTDPAGVMNLFQQKVIEQVNTIRGR